MRKQTLIATLLILLIFNFSVFAQDDEEYQSNDILEVSLFGGFSSPQGGITEWNNSLNADNGFNFGLDVGYFLNPNFVLGVNFTYTKFDIMVPASLPEADLTTHRLYNGNIYLKYIKLTTSNFEPFIKAYIGVENPKFATYVQHPIQDRLRLISYDPGFAYGISAGLFYFTSDYSGIYIEGKYHGASTSNVTADYLDAKYDFNEDVKKFDINIGIRLLAGSKE